MVNQNKSEQQAPEKVPFAVGADFNFQEVLVYLSRSMNECMYRITDDKVQKLLQVEGESVLIEIGSEDRTTLQIRYLNGTPTETAQTAVAEYVREWFDVDRDLSPFYELAEGDPVLKGLVEAYTGLRVVRIPDLFEALCWAIMGQQINLAFAYTLKRRFVETFGESLTVGGETYWLFPRPEQVAELAVVDLRALQFTGKKAEYLLEVASRLTAKALTKADLQSLPPQAVEKKMVSIRGIGPWTANYVRLRCLGDTSAFPLADVGLHNALKAQLGMERKPTLEEIEQLALPWKGWEAYATFYLWRSLY